MSEAHTYMEGGMLPLFGKDSQVKRSWDCFCSQPELGALRDNLRPLRPPVDKVMSES